MTFVKKVRYEFKTPHLFFSTLLFFSPLAWSNMEAQIELHKEIKSIGVELLGHDEALRVLHAEIANENKPDHLTLVSSTDFESSDHVDTLLSDESFHEAQRPSQAFIFKFPFQQIKNRISGHLMDQYSFYKSDKAAVVLLTVLTANTSVSWFVFSPNISTDQASIIVSINTFLYAYLGVNAPNWAQVLRSSKTLLQRSSRFRNLNTKLQDFLSIMSTNTLYNLGYHGLIQTILNWENLERMLSFDVIGLILKFTAITVATSGVWDLVLNEWESSGRISSKTRKKLSWGRSVIMVTLGNLMAIGVPDTLKGMLAFGAAGLEIYLLETNKDKILGLIDRVKKVKNLKPYFNFKKLVLKPFKLKRSPQAATPVSFGFCEMLLD